VERFEGMFAFAILDLRKREILLARDHFGIKPLIYRRQPGSFAFASEFQALQQLPDWSGEIDLVSIDQYLRSQYIPAPRTAWRNVFKLPAGHRMVVGIDEPRCSIERYFTPDFTRKRRRSQAALLEELDHCLRDSVRRHLVADVPFGAFLSGGIDSSLVVGYMSELLGRPVRTFSIGFDAPEACELKYARQVAEKYQTEHHEQVLNLEAFDVLPEIVRHYGEPYGDQSAVATWAVCRLAREHVPMVLSGDGGDEFFAGYGTYGNWLRSATTPPYRAPVQFLKGAVRSARNRLLRRQTLPVQKATHRLEQHWFPLVGRFHDHQLRSRLWRAELRFVADQPYDAYDRAISAADGLSTVNQAQYLDIETFLPEDILTKVDVASMSVGLEVRPPILDRRVFNLAASVPEEMLYGRSGDYSGKLPLKQLAAARLGDTFANRPKQGFSLPLERWLRGTPDRFAHCESLLLDGSSRLSDWFCPTAIRNVISSGTAENLWLLLVLHQWTHLS
jgi:asparagine synthase (glutamine-hydrolysing)